MLSKTLSKCQTSRLRGLKFTPTLKNNSIQLTWDLKTFAHKLRLTEYFEDHNVTTTDDELMMMLNCFCGMTDERRLVLFPPGTIVRYLHHHESPARRQQDYPPRNRNKVLETFLVKTIIGQWFKKTLTIEKNAKN